MKWISPWHLSRLGILGMNCRNRDFIGRYNERRLFPLVDDKLKTKLLTEEFGLASPALLFVVREQFAINRIEDSLKELDGFVVKPAKGSGGKGILVITGRRGDRFIKSSGAEIDIDEIRRHMSNTLAGLYSLGGKPDVVIVEELIEFDNIFDGYSHEGVPDIRVVVFRGYPVMAMMRLATHASDGKANLHQGAVGVGLDIATGRCLKAVQFGQPIKLHPDTHKPLDKIQVADWRALMVLASQCYEMTGLGYMGADIVLDKSRGPQVLELNARPGLSIQVANGLGLLPRLRHIESIKAGKHRTPESRVDYAVEAFAEPLPPVSETTATLAKGGKVA
ncbi:alpha-L-glutamate ligase-like protein [Marinimicrobium sp. C2-29]|uniref:alpha-L-glutamate ligase-like protein n=1 Tax=Marinimicrobium sp. C2-29 TaxID=3139825 RepID=UPI0040534FE2